MDTVKCCGWRTSLDVGLLCLVLASCTPLRPLHSDAAPNAAPAADLPGTAAEAPASASREVPAAAPSTQTSGTAMGTAPERTPEQTAAAPAAVEANPAPSHATASPKPARLPAKKPAPAASPAERISAAQQPVAAAADKAPEPPALDLTALEQRLRETHAIGVFTKLSLKNQVDDLLDQFRAFHSGRGKAQLAQLREQYDLLLLKVLSLLQDSDHELAAAISSSREAIWSVLTDPQKFAKLQLGA